MSGFFMEFLKKNYEKVALSVVLLGLAVAAALLLTQVAEERRRLDDIRNLNLTTAPKELVPMDTTTNLMLLARLQRPAAVTLAGTNNLFNPVTWQRRGDGRLEKIATGAEVGPSALSVQEIKPLYLKISFVRQTDSGRATQYSFRFEREAAAERNDRRPVTLSFTSVGSRNNEFLLREMRPAEEPTEFVFESLEDKIQMVVGPGNDFQRVAGYAATLRYDPENRSYRDKRVSDTMILDGETYKIVAITETSVTVEAPNRKRTTVTTELSSASGSP